MTKVCITIHKHTEILPVDIQNVDNFKPDDCLIDFMKDHQEYVKYSLIEAKHNHYKVLLHTDYEPSSVNNTLSLMMVWTD